MENAKATGMLPLRKLSMLRPPKMELRRNSSKENIFRLTIMNLKLLERLKLKNQEIRKLSRDLM
jgi:hypothetical protein